MILWINLSNSWRQAGILAAAGLYALDHHIDRLKIDHDLAVYLGTELAKLGVPLTKPIHTNMVWADVGKFGMDNIKLKDYLKKYQLKVYPDAGTEARFVIHIQTPKEAVDRLISAFQDLVKSKDAHDHK